MKRIVSFVLAVVLMIGMIPWQGYSAEAATAGDGTYIWPAPTSSSISVGWTYSDGDYHGATDFKVAVGTPVYATAAGTVIKVSRYECGGSHRSDAKEPLCDKGENCPAKIAWAADGTYGNYITIDHGNNVYSVYAHLQAGSYTVSVGQWVEQGQIIAYSGNAGNSTGPHLHFEIRMGGNKSSYRVDPQAYLTKTNIPDNTTQSNEIDTRYPTAFGAYTLLWNNTSDGKTWVSQTIGGENTSYISNGYNGEDDHCIIEEVYTNGWCKVSDIPGVSGARYCPLSVFVNVIDGYTPWWITAPKWAQTYRRWDTGSPQGYIDEGDSVCVISETETMYQVIFPTADGNLCRWVVKCDLGHSYKSTVTVAGCNTQGYTTYRCSVCGTSYKDSYTEATGHCHTSSVTAPTCTEQGYTTYTCTVCGESYIDSYTEAMGHSYSYSVSKEPTQDVQGTLTGQCGACADTVTVSLPKLNTTDYTYKVTKEPSYTATGTGRYTWKTTTYGTFYFEVTLDKLTATLTKIEVASKPTKMVYEIGESLDTTGLTLKATYSDGSTEIITSGFTTSGFDSSAAGKKTVTVTYGGKTTNFTITVEESEGVDPDAAQIVVSDSTGMVGQQVNVTIALANNPGVVSMMLSVGYDDDVLTLVSVTDGGQLGTAVHSDNYAACPYTLTWANDLATENYTYNGEIVTLTFEVSEDAQLGQTSVTIYYDYDNFDIFNVDGEEVWFEMVDGSVNVIDVLIGDVNSDGKVNTQDRMILTRYLAKWTGYTEDMINMTAADVNCDGKVNTQDRMILTRYLAKWTGYEELPYSG